PAALALALVVGAATQAEEVTEAQVATGILLQLVDLEGDRPAAMLHAEFPMSLVGGVADELQLQDGIEGAHVLGVVVEDGVDVLGTVGGDPAVDQGPQFGMLVAHDGSPRAQAQQSWRAGASPSYWSCRRSQFRPLPSRSGMPPQPSPRPKGVRSR